MGGSLVSSSLIFVSVTTDVLADVLCAFVSCIRDFKYRTKSLYWDR